MVRPLHGTRELLVRGGLHFAVGKWLVRPASSSFSQQMKVRGSTRTQRRKAWSESEEGVRALLLVELGEHTALDHLRGQAGCTLPGTVAESTASGWSAQRFQQPHDGIASGALAGAAAHRPVQSRTFYLPQAFRIVEGHDARPS